MPVTSFGTLKYSFSVIACGKFPGGNSCRGMIASSSVSSFADGPVARTANSAAF